MAQTLRVAEGEQKSKGGRGSLADDLGIFKRIPGHTAIRSGLKIAIISRDNFILDFILEKRGGTL